MCEIVNGIIGIGEGHPNGLASKMPNLGHLLIEESQDRIVPKPIKDYTKYISRMSSNRVYSFPRILVKCLESLPPDAVFVAGGLPNSGTFPIAEVSFKLRDGTEMNLGAELTGLAMQYGVTDGYKPLLDQLREFLERYHGVDEERMKKYRLAVSPGAQDALSKTIEAILNEGDYVITEDALYPGTIAALAAVKPRYLLVEGDGDGMKPESLRKVLAPWDGDSSSAGRRFSGKATSVEEDASSEKTPSPQPPKLIIICPSGGNPTGSCLTLRRKQEIYKIAQEHDLLILEDDPYFFVQFGKQRIPSFLSMDVDARVIRVDSFSKIVSAGMRLGFIVGPEAMVERVVMHLQISTMHTPGITQVMLQQLLQSWGWQKFEDHVEHVKEFYFKQKEATIALCKKYLSDVAEWEDPRGGMFIWIKIEGVPDTLKMCMERGINAGVVALSGRACSPCPENGSPYIRLSYSLVSQEVMEKGLKRLRAVILDEVEAQRN